tara:strand:+ start:22 stop:579 length:558 start_codon:yes stop_codon:yes gene_type:complete
MKSLDSIWDEYVDNDGLTPQTVKDLAWHIKNDVDPGGAIIMATDMRLKELGSNIFCQLDNEDDYISEISIGCLLGGLRLAEYAEKGLQMAQESPYKNVRASAIFSLGEVLDQIKDKKLKTKIARYIYYILEGDDLELHESFSRGAYNSVLTAMEIPILERPRVRDLAENIDLNLVAEFKKKYGIK